MWIFTRSGGEWLQQGSKLTASDEAGAANFGTTVALSADGNTLAIGGFNDNVGKGAVWIFTRTNGEWTQQGNKLVGTGYDASGGSVSQGWSVALSADGNTMAEGGRQDNSNRGAVWIFTRSGGVWLQQGSKLTASDESGAGEFGVSVALPADGNTLAVGGPHDGDLTNNGAVWIFTRTNGEWTQQGNKLVGTGAIGAANQGNSVALSADGNTLAVGGSTDASGVGAVWVFVRRAGLWTQMKKLVGSNSNGSPNQGFSLALSADGNTLAEGGENDGTTGAVWVFV